MSQTKSDSTQDTMSDTPDGVPPQDDPRWLDKPGSVDLLIKILVIACVVTVLADFGYHKHGEFHFQEFPGFDAIFGFLAYVGLVNLAKGVRVLLMRSEDYYD